MNGGRGATAPASGIVGSGGGWAGFSRVCELRWRGWLAKLIGARPAANALSIESRLDLGARKSLLVVACGERRFLVASGAETISALVEIRPGSGRGVAARLRRRRRR